jgi:hypothetical protein
MRPYLLILAVLCLPFDATAQAEFPSPEAFKKSVMNEKSQLSTEARGDLNGDGLADWTGVVRREKGDFLANLSTLRPAATTRRRISRRGNIN